MSDILICDGDHIQVIEQTGPAGPNSISDSTSIGSLSAESSPPWVLAANAAGTAARRTTSLPLSFLAPSGASIGQVPQWSGSAWVPATISGGGTPGGASGQLQYNASGVFGGASALVYAGSGTHLTVTSQSASTIPVAVVAHASQSANLQEWRSSGGTVISSINFEGKLRLSGDTTVSPILQVQMTSSSLGTYGPICILNSDGTPYFTTYDNGLKRFRVYNEFQSIFYGGIEISENRNVVIKSTGSFSVIDSGNVSTFAWRFRTEFTTLQVIGIFKTVGSGTKALQLEGVSGQTAPLLQLTGRSSTTDAREQVDIDSQWADSTDATRKARAIFRAWDTSARECLRLEASGSAPMIGFLGASAITRYSTTGTTTGHTGGGGTSLTHSDTFTGNTGTTAYTIGDVVRALKQYGLLAS